MAIAVAFTVAACCSPSEPTSSCQGPPDETMTPSAAKGTDPMGMAEETPPCSLYYLAKNDPVPPRYAGIGSAHWDVPAGQAYFDQGLRFFFAFNSRESYRAFHEAANEAESSNVPCSACYWAQALPLGVDINESEQSPYDRKQANAVLHSAEKANPSPEDRAIIDALLERNQECSTPDEKQCKKIRNNTYYDGMKKVLDAYGGSDPNIITLYADSVMNLTPWRYWDKDGKPVSDKVTDAQKQLEKALGFPTYRQNEGPIHFYIHLMEGSWTPELARRHADSLAPPTPSAPSAGHLVHMPSHIYYRVGAMQDAIKANKAAIDADDAYFAKEPNLYRPDGDRYRYEYYPHNIHFLLAAAVLSGDTPDRDIDRYSEKLLQSLPDNGNGLRAEKYRTTYYLAKLNFSRTADIRSFAQPDPFELQPIANLSYHFTQMMADIWDGNKPAQSADRFYDDIGKIRDAARKTEKNEDCDPSVRLPRDKDLCLAAILNYLGRARIAVLDAKRGDSARWADADAWARRALEIDDKLDYYEPPLWLYPTRQTLASVLIQRADAVGPLDRAWRSYLDDAKQQLLESLHEQPRANPAEMPIGIYPGNGWAYYGLLEIANRYDPAGVGQATLDLKTHWFGDPGFHTLDRM
ncbi:hypothetical protein [Mycobacterium rhizamassiliense]|uniref:hypothetical protein n=1 Tax=Mycobacterium rhizamassiliense TaxID=1841860 RepID=UPI001FE7082D|nr:hypothetical protein [Mycobacterium rhizamassiliense]